MHLGSTDFLELLNKHDCYILFEKGAPDGRLKQDFISLMTLDGHALEMRTPEGYHASPVQLPREIFDDFITARLIQQDGPEDSDGRIVFRLTDDGRIRGHNRSTVLFAMADYVQKNWRFAARGSQSLALDSEEREAKRVRILNYSADLETLAHIPLSESLPYEKVEAIVTALNNEGLFLPSWQIKSLAEATAQQAA